MPSSDLTAYKWVPRVCPKLTVQPLSVSWGHTDSAYTPGSREDFLAMMFTAAVHTDAA